MAFDFLQAQKELNKKVQNQPRNGPRYFPVDSVAFMSDLNAAGKGHSPEDIETLFNLYATKDPNASNHLEAMRRKSAANNTASTFDSFVGQSPTLSSVRGRAVSDTINKVFGGY